MISRIPEISGIFEAPRILDISRTPKIFGLAEISRREIGFLKSTAKCEGVSENGKTSLKTLVRVDGIPRKRFAQTHPKESVQSDAPGEAGSNSDGAHPKEPVRAQRS